MPVMLPMPTAGASQLAGNLWNRAGDDRNMAFRARQAALERMYGRRNQLLSTLSDMRARRDYQKSQDAASETPWGSIGGAAGGAALGALLAVPTGGLSIAAGGLMGAGVGGNVGQAFNPRPTAPNFSQFSQLGGYFQGREDEYGDANGYSNPFYFADSPDPLGPAPVEASAYDRWLEAISR